ncbi:hypothetical protein LJC72_13255 [Bacteroides sp. OttesenSCG-928-D19]|nr:hypothetical protein [Bacteroides sp. OttesenSCG-928-D19]
MEYKTRKLTEKEENILAYLVENATIEISPNWKNNLVAHPLQDGGMGSLQLIYLDRPNEERTFSKRISEALIKDIDGVDVLISLNIDNNNQLFELDIWKTDYEQIIELPNLLE